MRSLRRAANARARSTGEEVGITTTTDQTGTWHSLDLEQQAYQALLEGHRLDPDNPELYQDFLKARAAMTTTWLEHTVMRTTPKVTLGVLAGSVTFLIGSHAKMLILRSGIHRRRQP